LSKENGLKPYDPRLALIGRCVDCRRDSMVPVESGFECDVCGRKYEFDEDGILRAFPETGLFPLPSIYNTPDFKRWVEVWEEMIPNWNIYKTRFRRLFSMSGHRKTRGFIERYVAPDIPVIDMGCGHGQLFQVLAPERCVGLDANLKFLRVLKKRFPEALAIHGDFSSVPFASGCLQCVVSLHTLEHLYFLAESLEEVKRALAPEGFFFFSIPTEGGIGWELGRCLITGPYLKRRYNMSVRKIMDIEHINNARRVLKFLGFYFDIAKTMYAPFSFIRSLHVNASISGVARHKK